MHHQACLALLGCALLTVPAGAQSRHHRTSRAAGTFDYYLLSLSYAPDFCAQPGGNKDPRECGKGRQLGFVVHGLWPQSESGPGPERCGPASPVSQAIVQVMLHYIPSPSLIQHE
jgi:ribonuclease T2